MEPNTRQNNTVKGSNRQIQQQPDKCELDINVRDDEQEQVLSSPDSFALSRLSCPSYVSGLESFSDFEGAGDSSAEEIPSYDGGHQVRMIAPESLQNEAALPYDAQLSPESMALNGKLLTSHSVLSLTGSDLSLGGGLMDLNSPSPSSLLAIDSFLNSSKQQSFQNPLFSKLASDERKLSEQQDDAAKSPFNFPKDLLCASDVQRTPGVFVHQKDSESCEADGADGCPEQRPGLDGSSSDSDDGAFMVPRPMNPQSVGRDMQQDSDSYEDETSSLPEVRQLAEGGDVLPYMPGDGGGGGDGSSGHSDSDMDGDGGVAIRVSQPSATPPVTRPMGDVDLRLTAGLVGSELEALAASATSERVRPVGDSFPVASGAPPTAGLESLRRTIASSRQVNNSIEQQNEITVNGEQEEPDSCCTDSADSTQDSRISNRFFMMSATPGAALQHNATADQPSWFNDVSTFHITPIPLEEDEDRTLIADETPNSMPNGLPSGNLRRGALGESLDDDNTLSQTSDLEFEVADFKHDNDTTSKQPSIYMGKKTHFAGVAKRDAMLHSTPSFPAEFNSPAMASKSLAINPFDTTTEDSNFKPELKDSMNISYNPFDHSRGGMDYAEFSGERFNDSEFQTICSDPDAMFDEDEKNHQDSNVLSNIVYASMTDWSVNASNIANESVLSKVVGANDQDEQGDRRISWYFSAKSENLGQLYPQADQARPTFDDSKEIRSPEQAPAIRLVRNGRIELDGTIVKSGLSDETFTLENQSDETVVSGKDRESGWSISREDVFQHKRELIGEDSFDEVGSKNSSSERIEKKGNERNYSVGRSTGDDAFGSVHENQSDVLSENSFDRPQLQSRDEETFEEESFGFYKGQSPAAVGNHILANIKNGRISLAGMSGSEISALTGNLAFSTGIDPNVIIKLLFSLQEYERKRKRKTVDRIVNMDSTTSCSSDQDDEMDSAQLTRQDSKNSASIQKAVVKLQMTEESATLRHRSVSEDDRLIGGNKNNNTEQNDEITITSRSSVSANALFPYTQDVAVNSRDEREVTSSRPDTSVSELVFPSVVSGASLADGLQVRKDDCVTVTQFSNDKGTSIIHSLKPVSSVLPLQCPTQPVMFRDCSVQCNFVTDDESRGGLPNREKSYEKASNQEEPNLTRSDAVTQVEDQTSGFIVNTNNDNRPNGSVNISPVGHRDESILASSFESKLKSKLSLKEDKSRPFLNSTAVTYHAGINHITSMHPLAEVKPMDQKESSLGLYKDDVLVHRQVSQTGNVKQLNADRLDGSNLSQAVKDRSKHALKTIDEQFRFEDSIVTSDNKVISAHVERIPNLDSNTQKIMNYIGGDITWKQENNESSMEHSGRPSAFSPLLADVSGNTSLDLVPTSEAKDGDLNLKGKQPSVAPVALEPHVETEQTITDVGYQTLPIQGLSRQQNQVEVLEVTTQEKFSGKTVALSPPVIVDEDLIYKEIQCVGVNVTKILKLHNAGSRWMQCRLKCGYYTVNGSKMDPEQGCAFILQERVILPPHTTEQVKVKFEPKVPGLYVAKIAVDSCPAVPSAEGQDNQSSTCQYVHAEGFAELPNIEILQEDSQIDFGEISYGGSKSRPIRMINKGQASVPIRMIISGSATIWPCFSFVNSDSSPRGSPNGKFQRVGSMTTPPMLSFTLPGKNEKVGSYEPCVVWIQFKAPHKQEKKGLKGKLGPPEEFTARVDLEVHGKGTDLILGSVLMKALVGLAKLYGAKDLRAVTLSTTESQRVSRSLELLNAGNISMHVDLKFQNNDGLFAVLPDKVVLRPNQKTEVFVHFESPRPTVVDTSLLLFIPPDGPCHELHVRGMAAANKTLKDDGQALLCNKPVLCWAGVQLGQSKQQRITLRNNTSHNELKLSLSIQGGHSDFQIQNAFANSNDEPNSHKITVKPQEDYVVHVLFIPSCFGHISSALVVQAADGGSKYKIPLHGHGGTSYVVPTLVRKSDEGYWYSIEKMTHGKSNVVRLSLKNTGVKDAFVKVVCYSDVNKLSVYPESLISLPDDFILPEKSSKELVIVVQPMMPGLRRPSERNSPSFYLVIYSGDEWLRQLYKSKISGHKNAFPKIKGGRLKGLSFTSPFSGEEKVFEDVLYPDLPDWESFFQSCVTQTVVAMVEESVGNDHQQTVSKAKTPDLLISELIPVTPAVKLAVKTPAHDARSDRSQRPSKSWTVIPESITLTASRSFPEKCAAKVHIVNYTREPLHFQFFWPSDILDITPKEESVPPKSQLAIIINIKQTVLSNGRRFPWQGSIYIRSDKEQKLIKAQIREDITMEGSPYAGLSKEAGKLNPLVRSHTPSVAVEENENIKVFSVKPTLIVFKTATVKSDQEESLTMQNNSETNVKWVLSSVAPTYLKSGINSGDIFRVTYSAFRFNRSNGKLRPGEGTKVTVTFMPRDYGLYSQYWDIRVSLDDGQVISKVRVQLDGECPQKANDVSLMAMSQKQVGRAQPIVKLPADTSQLDRINAAVPATGSQTKQSIGHKHTHSRGMFVKEDHVQFPPTTKGSESKSEFRLCNDTGEIQRARLSGVRAPFHLKHFKVAIKPKSFVRVPVFFVPTDHTNSLESLLVVTTEMGETLCIKLSGIIASK